MAVSDDERIGSDDLRAVELDEDFSVLPDQTSDDTDRGWGEAPARRPRRSEFSVRDLDLLAERPPHW
ncbi:MULTISPECIES: hypothetical protein [Glycomyces]|uniref:Uncharacterized protein n=2 Tax=Glycomyces TaxID=58113 RepID=A0A9X3PL57_9ACTN|nr:hypothetical protein [Glycomyces lechevalierae]MDA1387516.1 hypothetical protein [Glycomyces lechevalierae]MDR7338692.1 hypothetical protein [Glycomyces lechevalierae]